MLFGVPREILLQSGVQPEHALGRHGRDAGAGDTPSVRRRACCHACGTGVLRGASDGEANCPTIDTRQADKSQPLGSEGQTAALTVLSDDAHELKDAFNAGKDSVRVVLLVSPRCPMCQAGARLVQEQALERIDSDKLKIYVVWIKRFFGDSRDAAEKSMALVPDKRARHFWDGNNQMPKHYGKSLDLPGERNFAWDVYFVFNPKAAWGETPPTPDFWMHQLGGSETGNRLDGDKFRDAIRERMPK